MRKAIVAGLSAVTLVALMLAVAPTVWSQGKPAPERPSEGPYVRMLDGRGSTIGVSIRDLEAEDVAKAKLERAGGVLIERVEDESPAAKAGLADGDVVVEFDGERVRGARHFARLVQETPGGRAVKATVVRGGARHTLEVTPETGERLFGRDTMAIMPDIEREIERGMRALPRHFSFDFDWDGAHPGMLMPGRARLGLSLAPLTEQLAGYFGATGGVLVSSVEADSPAAKAGLTAGDVITSVNGRSVDAPADVTSELREAASGTDVEFAVLRDRKPLTLKAQIPERARPERRRLTRPV